MIGSTRAPRGGQGVQGARAAKAVLCGGTAMMLVFAASAAQAQCAAPGVGTFTLPVPSVGSSVQSLVAVLTTQNTASITNTSGFIGAPANPSPNLQGGGVWVRGLGGTFDTNVPGSVTVNPSLLGGAGTTPCNVRTFQDFSGFQAGADIARLNLNGFNIHGGVTVGYTESTIRSSSGFRGDFQTPFIGLYGAITKGSFFADGQVRWDFYQGVLNDANNTLYNQRLDARSLSLTGNVGYQFGFEDGWFVEPSAGAVYSEAKVDTLEAGGTFFIAGNPNFGFPTQTKIRDFDSILARGSVRVGRNFVVDGYALQPFFTASVINEFAGNVRTDVTTTLGTFGGLIGAPGLGIFDTSARINTARIGTYGQFSVGIAGQILNTGWLGYVRGDYRTGDRVEGYTISGGIRYQFNPEAPRTLISKDSGPILAPLDAPINWTGFSVGGSAGGLWSQTRQINSTFTLATIERADPHVAGLYAGGQVGVDYQFNQIVVGIAGDGGWVNARGGRGCSPTSAFLYNCQSNIDTLYMATGRVGYATERTLFYAKGGAAFADTTDRQQNNFNSQTLTTGFLPTVNSTVTSFNSGWTVGAGFEYAITKNWSAKAEYMHYELDQKRYTNFPSANNQAFVTTKNTGDLVRVGVNYRFNFGAPEVVAAAPAPVVRKY